MLTKSVTIAIVDRQALYRGILKEYLSERRNANVVIQSSGMDDLLPKLKFATVEILILNSFMVDFDSYELLKSVRTEYPEIKILISSMDTNLEMINELMNEGIYGYISQSDGPEELLRAISSAVKNETFRTRLFTDAFYWNKENLTRNECAKTLTEREKKILKLLWEEKSNKEIADELFLGTKSVEKIRKDIKEKIGAKSTVGLLKYAIKKNIILTNLTNQEAAFVKPL